MAVLEKIRQRNIFLTIIIGLALIAAATGIIVSGVAKLIDWAGGKQLAAPGWLALAAAIISILVKEVLFRYTAIRGKHLDSQALIANAWQLNNMHADGVLKHQEKVYFH